MSASASILYNVAEQARALVISRLMEQRPDTPHLHICPSDRLLHALVESVEFFIPNRPVYVLPAWDTLPYDRNAPHPGILAKRLATLYALTQPQTSPPLVLTTASALLQRLPPRASIIARKITLTTATTLEVDSLATQLNTLAYHRNATVREPGEYAIRGNIIDIYPTGSHDQAYRVDLFGDEIESIRAMDPLTQRSGDKVKAIDILPASEIALDVTSIERFRSKYRAIAGVPAREDALYSSTSEGIYHAGAEQWLPCFYDALECLQDYLPDAHITMDEDTPASLHDRQEMVKDYYEARITQREQSPRTGVNYHPVSPHDLYQTPQDLEPLLTHALQLWGNTPSDLQGVDSGLRYAVAPHITARSRAITPLEQFLHEAREHVATPRSVVVAAHTAGSAARFMELLKPLNPQRVTHWHEVQQAPRAGLFVAWLPMERGICGADDGRVIIYSEQDILGLTLSRSSKRRARNAGTLLQEAAAFEMGELLVHAEHGIGRFDGLITLSAAGVDCECVRLLYRDGDKLFVPVANMDVLSRYGNDTEHDAILDKLGAGQWQQRKARMKERITLTAGELMKTAAARSITSAPILIADTERYARFCARFPYAETEDQERSIEEVEQDLQSGHPMDRLICGDVGFGKTEVAIRAAFIAMSAEEPVQVALIAPTTLLARQHYYSFSKRFKEEGLRIAQLSRLCTAKQVKETKAGLKDGSIHMVIGTHALLAQDVHFANLGLVIVDEEQHFGVKQKEKLKALKSNVHVLTLSATPIPRTLQLSLSGVRDLSLITTPPVDRLAVRTFVSEFDAILIKEAITRELHRGGQCFFVTPRISDLAELEQTLRQMLPQLKLAIGHGQMPASELDTLMQAFDDGAYDMLLSTAIVESGLDVPNANTMFIHKADRFGLGQLYQLRGRVGRGKTRAFAYLLTPPRRKLTEDAKRRLDVMHSLDTLGAGFTLASHDMDSRGFGNLVGEEQSGHVREVGIELYQQMLKEAIDDLKHAEDASISPAQGSFSPQLNLGITALLPEHYVADLRLRMSLYRRLSNLHTADDIEAFAAEMIDRFGALPEEAKNLLWLMQLKLRCILAHIDRLDIGPKGILLGFHKDIFPKPEALISYIATHAARIKIRPDQRLFYAFQDKDSTSPHEQAQKLVHALCTLL